MKDQDKPKEERFDAQREEDNDKVKSASWCLPGWTSMLFFEFSGCAMQG
jgi:hypothetical protein